MSQRNVMCSCLMVLLVMLTASVSAQPAERPQPGMGRPDAVWFLKQALEEAGATALSAEQEKQIQTLAQSIRDTFISKQPNQALETALSAYHEAVLSGNLAGAKSAAMTFAAEEAENTRVRLEEQAAGIVQLLAILSPDQVNKLVARFETDGAFHVFQTVVGGPMGGRAFRGRMGPGPMRGRPPRE